MTDDLRKSIDTLRGVTSRMEAATAEAEHVVRMVEKFLNEECELGVAVWSGAAEHRAPAAAVGGGAGAAEAAAAAPKSLGYAKVAGRFRIAIREASALGERVYAWADAPRGEKLQCFGQLPALLNHMASLVQDYLESAGQTSVAVAGTLEVLGRGTSKTISVSPAAPAPAITAPVAAFTSRPAVKPAAPVNAPAAPPEPAKTKPPLVTRVPAKPRGGKASVAAAAAAAASTVPNVEPAPKPVAPEAPPMRREYPAHHTGRPLRLF
jgi:hypothetical protein